VSMKCPACDDTGEMFVIPQRLMGATYSFDDTCKGDEHYEPCPLCKEENENEYRNGKKRDSRNSS